MTMAASPLRARLRDAADPAALPPRWPWLFRLFRWYARRYAAKYLHAVRVSKASPIPAALDGPVIVVLNHPSWWDPLLCYVVSGLLSDRTHWGLIDQAGLRRYRFLARAGLFGVEVGSARGAAQFLRTARAILDDTRAVLWITAQGRFADARERPPRLRPGVGHLATLLDRGTVLPMAVEMTFWDERTAEALIRFGSPVNITGHEQAAADEWTATIECELQAAQDALAAEAMRRDPAQFDTLVSGRAGVGGVYDLGRRLRAWLRGERFDAEHSPARGKEN
jgi:1-acyl-sn-glycerol-3-phosphate acyltransferase